MALDVLDLLITFFSYLTMEEEMEMKLIKYQKIF